MRKPVFLAILGISIVVAAVSLGVILTRYLGLLAYSPKGTAQAAATPAGDNVQATPPEQWYNLFAPGDGMTLASRLPAVDPKTGSRAVRGSFVLVGTIVSSTSSDSRGVLWASGMKEPKAFRVKEEVEPGAFLVSVERDKVWIERGKEREKLEILPVGRHDRATGTGTPNVAPTGASASSQPAYPPGMPSRPETVASPTAIPGAEDDELRPRDRRRRLQGSRR